MEVKELTQEQLADISRMRHIRNLLRTIMENLKDREFRTMNPQGIDAIFHNVNRALTASENELTRYRETKETE